MSPSCTTFAASPTSPSGSQSSAATSGAGCARCVGWSWSFESSPSSASFFALQCLSCLSTRRFARVAWIRFLLASFFVPIPIFSVAHHECLPRPRWLPSCALWGCPGVKPWIPFWNLSSASKDSPKLLPPWASEGEDCTVVGDGHPHSPAPPGHPQSSLVTWKRPTLDG